MIRLQFLELKKLKGGVFPLPDLATLDEALAAADAALASEEKVLVSEEKVLLATEAPRRRRRRKV